MLARSFDSVGVRHESCQCENHRRRGGGLVCPFWPSLVPAEGIGVALRPSGKRGLAFGGSDMALFTQTPRKDEPGAQPEPKSGPSQELGTFAPPSPPRRVEEPPKVSAPGKVAESVLSSGLSIEGKIEGSGNVRVAAASRVMSTSRGIHGRVRRGRSRRGACGFRPRRWRGAGTNRRNLSR